MIGVMNKAAFKTVTCWWYSLLILVEEFLEVFEFRFLGFLDRKCSLILLKLEKRTG